MRVTPWTGVKVVDIAGWVIEVSNEQAQVQQQGGGRGIGKWVLQCNDEHDMWEWVNVIERSIHFAARHHAHHHQQNPTNAPQRSRPRGRSESSIPTSPTSPTTTTFLTRSNSAKKSSSSSSSFFKADASAPPVPSFTGGFLMGVTDKKEEKISLPSYGNILMGDLGGMDREKDNIFAQGRKKSIF
ncbi:hypothetical protein HK104_001925 [Borealophlyctis nickersoniae]|nr:hypothetical protein HK104_001925 [Borealophlyctis nickersoniae]